MSPAPFAPCPSCSRHVRVDAATCPFCASDLAHAAFDPVPDAGGRRLGRAALFAFATTVAAAGCPSPQRPDNGNNNVVQPYGAPPTPTPPNDAGTVAAPPDPGLVVAIYGAPMPPPPDAAAPDATAPDATAPTPDAPRPAPDARPPRPPRPGPPMVRYGAPPPPDPSDAA